MSVFKKAISATTGAVKNFAGGDKEKDRDSSRGSMKVYSKKKYDPLDDEDPFAHAPRDDPFPASPPTTHRDMEEDIDQNVLDMLDELQDEDTVPTPTPAPAARERQSHARVPSGNYNSSNISSPSSTGSFGSGSGMTKSPSSGNLHDHSINSSSRLSMPPNSNPRPVSQSSPALTPHSASQSMRPSTIAPLQQPSFAAPARPAPPARKIPVPPKTDNIVFPNDLGPAKFGFNIITTIPLSPRWITFIIAVFLPRTGTKIILRRYKHMEDLHSQLLEYYEEVPPFPPPLTWDADKASTIHVDDHRIRLQQYLNAIGELPQLVNQHPIISFIGGPIKDPRQQTRPRFGGDFADEEADDKFKRELCEWKIQEHIDHFVHINTALGNLLSVEIALLKVRSKNDWAVVSDASRIVATLGKLLEGHLTENRFVPKHISAQQAEAITEFRLRTIVDSLFAAISEIASKLRRMWCTQLDPATLTLMLAIEPTRLNELRALTAKATETFHLHSVISPLPGYKLEYGTPDFSWKSWPSFFSQNSPWFHDYFFNREHVNLMGTHPQYGPMVVSFMAEETDDKYAYFRAIIRSERGNVKHVTGARGRESAEWHNSIGVIRDVLERMEPYTRAVDFTVIRDETLSDELLVFESRDMRVTPHFKIGVLYCARGQTTEEQMFSNSAGTADYDRFLDLIGDKIVLAGWNRYNGGLDTKGPNTTGTHSYFTTFSGYDIMFHVSTMFPFSTEGGAQQVHKKRHLGNDIILVVFQDEGSEDYTPNCVRSQYIQVVIVVRKLPSPPDSNDVYYKVNIVRNADVPTFGPPLPFPNVFKHGPEFRSWLLYKIVNGELAAYRSPLFIKQLSAGFRSQCETLFEKYYRPPAESTSPVDLASDGMRKGIKVAGKAVSGLGKGVNKLVSGVKKEINRDDKRDSYQ